MKFVVNMLVIFLLTLQCGCATIVSSTDKDVQVMSAPSGAKVTVDGIVRGKTPLVVSLERKQRHSIQVEEDGYDAVIRDTSRRFNWWYLGNIVFGGVIGLIVDAVNGSMYDIEPSEISVDLESI